MQTKLIINNTPLFVIVILLCSRFIHTQEDWNYDICNGEGPQEWNQKYPLCGTGMMQSPIDVNTFETKDDALLEPLRFHWDSGIAKVHFNGETCQIDVPSDTMFITGGPLGGGHKYYMTQFHTHETSEHHLDGVAYPLEIHFVHKSKNTGRLAVVAFFFRIGSSNSSFISEFIDFCESEEYEEDHLDFSKLLGTTADLPYLTYVGSLTTPPCTEFVQWILIQKEFSISRVQLRRFMSILPHHFSNNRPIQDLHQRTVSRYTPPTPDPVPQKSCNLELQNRYHKATIILSVLTGALFVVSLLLLSGQAVSGFYLYKRKGTKAVGLLHQHTDQHEHMDHDHQFSPDLHPDTSSVVASL